MARLRTYTKEGAQLSDVNSPVGGPQLCWVGGEKYVVCNGTRLVLATIGASEVVQMVQLVALGGTDRFRGVAAAHRHVFDEGGEHAFQPDDQCVLVTLKEGIGGLDHQTIRAYDIATGIILWTHDFGGSSDNGPIATNGMNWFMGWENAVAVKSLGALDIDGAVVNALYNITPAIIPKDLCHDGASLWSIEDGVIRQLVTSPTAPFFKEVSSFTATGAGVGGITTDGHRLIVLSET